MIAMRPIVALAVLLAALPAAAGRLVLEGSSNLAPWRCSSTVGTFGRDELRVPVSAIRCGNRQMERDLRRSLRADEYPDIEFRLGALPPIPPGRERFTATIHGVLSLAGASKDVALRVDAERLDVARYRLSARLPLRMTDFAITPPTALFGMIRARDELVVQLEMTVGE